jgi:hypothetical protein
MINNCVGMLLNGAKTLLGKKSTQDILKYLGTVTIKHLANKYKLSQQKYDPNDLKNMVYHYNMNNGPVIDKTNIDQAIDIMNLNRFMNEMAYRENISGDVTGDVISQLARILNDNNISLVYNDMATNGIIQQFDTDTIETSSIADNYEISSGGIYLPDNNVMTSTIEGCNLANAKNDYLNKRMSIGEDAPVEQVQSLLKEYYNNIDFDSVLQYFNN